MGRAAACTEGFRIIHGPPGTGKSQTLLHLVNALHLQSLGAAYGLYLDWQLRIFGDLVLRKMQLYHRRIEAAQLHFLSDMVSII